MYYQSCYGLQPCSAAASFSALVLAFLLQVGATIPRNLLPAHSESQLKLIGMAGVLLSQNVRRQGCPVTETLYLSEMHSLAMRPSRKGLCYCRHQQGPDPLILNE